MRCVKRDTVALEEFVHSVKRVQRLLQGRPFVHRVLRGNILLRGRQFAHQFLQGLILALNPAPTQHVKRDTVALEGFVHSAQPARHLQQGPYLVQHVQPAHILLQVRQVALQILQEHILAHEQVLIPRALRDTVALEAFSAHVHQERFLQRGRPFVPHVMQVNILLLLLVLAHLSLVETILALDQALIQSAPQDIVALVVFLQYVQPIIILQ